MSRCIAIALLSSVAVGSPLFAVDWRPIGPWGGFVEQLERCDARPTIFYGLGNQGRVHRSVDGGRSWHSANGDLPAGAARYGSLLVDGADCDLLWLSGDRELWQTEDGGAHWSLRSPLPFDTRLLAAAPDGDALFAGGPPGLFRSVDRGATWLLVRRGLVPGYGVTSMAIDRLDPRLQWAAVRGRAPGVYASHDGGTSWRRLQARKIFALQADPHAAGTVLGLEGYNLVRSRDGGATWAVLATDPGFTTGFVFGAGKPSNVLFWERRDIFEVLVEIDGRTGASRDLGQPLPRNFDASSIALDPAGDIVVSGFGGIVRSADRAATWEASDRGFAGLVSGPVVVLGPTALIAGNHRTLDGGAHWTRFLPDQEVTDLAVDPTDRNVVYAGTGLATVDGTLDGVYKSEDSGETWHPAAEGLTINAPTSIAIDPRAPRTLYCATAYDGLFQTTDGGARWRRIAADTIPGASELNVSASGTRCVYLATFGGLRRSCDDGASWSTSLLRVGPWSNYALSRSDPQRIDATEGLPDAAGAPLHFLRSTDGGASFTASALPTPTFDRSFLAIDQRHPDRVYLAASTDFREGGVWMRDGDGPWQEISDGLFNRDLRGLRYVGGPRPRLLVSTAAGVFLKLLDD